MGSGVSDPVDSLGKTNVSQEEVKLRGVSGISSEAVSIITWITYGVVCQLIDIFGIVTNIINIICFVKQGFKDSINVSLLGLSVSDLGCLVTQIMTNICQTFGVNAADLPFDPLEVTVLVTSIPHISFARVSSWVTAIITLERCLCVMVPLKIKSMVTPQRATGLISCVFIILLGSVAPVYVTNKLDNKFFPGRNKTLIGLVSTDSGGYVNKIAYTINFILPFVSFIIIVVCTIILVIKLKATTKWRKKSASQSQAGRVFTSNEKVASMVVIISSLFIVSFVPLSVFQMAMVVEPELYVGGKYINISVVLAGLGFILESVNSSVNIFIYYHMSSKYRGVFKKIFYDESIEFTR